MPSVLGLSAYYHDSAACLIVDGQVVAAAQEERFSRRKHDDSFPSRAVDYCLREAAVRVDDLSAIAFYEKPLVKFDRLLETYLATAPRGLRSYLKGMPVWLGEKLWLADEIRRELGTERRILFGDHHESHAASAFYPSPFEEAAVLTIDGVGEWSTASVGYGNGADLTMLREMRFPHSIGLLYSAITYFIGFDVNDGEHKVMGLAPYGSPSYAGAIRDHLVDIRSDGSIRLNLEALEFVHGGAMTGRAFEQLFGPRRKPGSEITSRDMDLARSIQAVVEEVMLRMARTAHRETGSARLCLAGGVALNCVGNGRLLREGPFRELWIQPAAGDAGGALGVAYAVWHRYLGHPRRTTGSDAMHGALLGPSFSDDEIGSWLRTIEIDAKRTDRADLPERVARFIAEGKVVGLFQGRMEFGPRALGCRSIIADARSPAMQSVLNLKIKFRESFRPFAPAVLREHVAEWFELDTDSPYMLLVADVAASRRLHPPDDEAVPALERLKQVRSTIPAVTHVDHSARIQTVRRRDNPLYYDIIRAFNVLTGCPVVVNTSFNVRDEPIVCTPQDAYRCFMKTGMDVLVLESYIVTKADASRRA